MRRSTRVALAAILAVTGSAMAVSAMPAVAVNPVSMSAPTPVAKGTPLSAAHPVLDFAGRMQSATPLPTVSNPDPSLCAVDCQLWSLTVRTTHRFLVSIHNGNSSIDDGFNLYVYDPAGNRVGAASGIGANGQAVTVAPTSAGVYTIAVTVTYAYDAVARYFGEVRLMTPPSWDVAHCAGGSVCDILPALRVQPPADVHVDGVPPVASTPLGFPFPVDVSTGNSCYVDETAATGATRCLRFTSVVDNVGAGPLTLQIPYVATSTGQPVVAFAPGECHADQVIERSDGTTRTHPAGACLFHPQHAHFHYKDFVAFSLHKVNADGTTGKQVARSLKESFCLADDGYFGFGTAGPNGQRDYVGQPDCNLPTTPSTQSQDAWIRMGVSPGWGDIYTWDTPSQYIDVTTTPPRVYDIVSRANPAGELVVSGPPSPCAATRIKLTATAVHIVNPNVPCH